MHPIHYSHHSCGCAASLKVNGAAVGDELSPNVCQPQTRSVENPHSQLKLKGNFEPQGKHPSAISHFMYIHSVISYNSRVKALGL